MANSISPEDPTISMYAVGRASRNLYFELDTIGWAKKIPQVITDEILSADHVIDVNNWPPNVLKPIHLRELGFSIEKEFPNYTIWTKQKIKRHN